MTRLPCSLPMVILLGCQASPASVGAVPQDSAASTPPASAPARSETDRVDLQVHRVADLPGIGEISDLALVQVDGAPVLLASGTCGFAEVDPARRVVLRTQKFDLPCPPLLESRIVDVDADGEPEFARFSPGWLGPTAVLNRDGSTRWESPTPAASATVSDLDGDGKGEILTREANSDVVVLLDDQGRVRWERNIPSGPAKPLVLLDTDADGKQEILASDGEGVQIYSYEGSPVGSIDIPGGGYIGRLQCASLGTASGKPEVIVGVNVKRGPDKGQWYHRYAGDAKTYLGRESSPVGAETVAVIPAAQGHGSMSLALLNELYQAQGAGFESSLLVLRVTGEAGETLAETTFSTSEAAMNCKALVLDGSPARVLIGYGAMIWEVTLR